MLLLQTSFYCQASVTCKSQTIVVPSTLTYLLHSIYPPKQSQNDGLKRTFLRIKWRQGGKFLPHVGLSDQKGRQMRFTNVILAMEPGTACITPQSLIEQHMTTNNSVPTVGPVSRSEVSVSLAPIQNKAFLHTLKRSSNGAHLSTVMWKDVRGQEDDRHETRKSRGEANKEGIPLNSDDKNNDCTNINGVILHTKATGETVTDDRELLRRQRISEANKGKVPWNKGGKHSSETRKRIRAGVIERMKDPKIREKLRAQAEASNLSPDVKRKIRDGIIRSWNRKKLLIARQALCLQEWKEMIAETARKGSEGEIEYQWDSYAQLKRQASQVKKVPTRRPERLSAEHRLRIAAAIKAKWSDPEYRLKVEKGIRDYIVRIPSQRTTHQARHSARSSVFSVSSKSFNADLQPTFPDGDPMSAVSGREDSQKDSKKSYTSKLSLPYGDHEEESYNNGAGISQTAPIPEMMEQENLESNINVPAYKDPETEKKLKKLISMRARRVHAEAKKQREITERARILIAQAQVAAKALEAAAVKDRTALAPLLETRKLLEEAVHSLEALSSKNKYPEHVPREDELALYTQVMDLANAVSLTSSEITDYPEWDYKNSENLELSSG
ncbi:hypothetical protein KP509_21G079500 [Ceratopteris richardii]|uniref:Nuclease associated modular domain-containing protein n=3 Tax=Ceratopteris richardii TaxID=49495 RepID=A0A8T2SBQ1_CERRI|nr:hypothetical protein KP509_21G079500 [Ceratopteris richardii]